MAEKKIGTKKQVAKKQAAKKQSSTKTAIKTHQVEAVSGSRNVVAWSALLLSGLAVGSVVWYFTVVGNVGQRETRFNVLNQRVDEIDAAQSDNNDAVGQLKNQLAQITPAQDEQDALREQIKTMQNEFENKFMAQKSATQQAINAQTENLRQQLNALSDAVVKLRAEQGRDMDSRTLEQAEQLIFMANQQVQFGGQFGGGSILAKRALQDADALLQKLANPALDPLRQLLDAEIKALDAVKVVDIVAVLDALSVLSSTVENLALAGDIVIPEKATEKATEKFSAETDADSAQTASAQSAADASAIDRYVQPLIDAGASLLSSVGDLIQVEKNGKSVKPIISAAVRQMTYQRAKLILESAQIAFIRQQSELYQHQIQSARNWVEENFAQNTAETAAWLAQLDAVGSISLQSNMPDISASLKAIRERIKNSNPQAVGVELHQAQ